MSTNRIRFAPLPITLAMLAACASTTGCASAPVERADGLAFRTQPTRSLVTASDLKGFAADESLFESLRRIRPEMFIARTRDLSPSVVDPYAAVYLDGVLQGKLETLQSIPSRVARQVEYLSAVSAQFRYREFHPGGVIDVRTR